MGEVLSAMSNSLKGDNKTMDAIYNIYHNIYKLDNIIICYKR